MKEWAHTFPEGTLFTSWPGGSRLSHPLCFQRTTLALWPPNSLLSVPYPLHAPLMTARRDSYCSLFLCHNGAPFFRFPFRVPALYPFQSNASKRSGEGSKPGPQLQISPSSGIIADSPWMRWISYEYALFILRSSASRPISFAYRNLWRKWQGYQGTRAARSPVLRFPSPELSLREAKSEH